MELVKNINKTTWVNQLLITQTDVVNEAYLRCKARTRYLQSVSPSYLQRTVLPSTGVDYRFTKIDGVYYYDWTSLPVPVKEAIGDIKQYQATTEKNTYETFKAAIEYYNKANLNNNVEAYAAYNGTKLMLLMNGYNTLNYIKLAVNNAHSTQYSAIIAHGLRYILEANIKYVPRKLSTLKRCISKICKTVKPEDVVKVPREKNQNSLKWGGVLLTEWLTTLRCECNYTDAYIARKIATELFKEDKPAPSNRWLTSFLQKREIKLATAEARYGTDSRFAKKERTYIPLATALHAGDCWDIDGTRVNMLPYANAETKK